MDYFAIVLFYMEINGVYWKKKKCEKFAVLFHNSRIGFRDNVKFIYK